MATIKARSIGSKTAYSTGTLTVSGSGLILTIAGGSFDVNWGEGDAISIDGEVRYVLSRDSATQLTLQTATTKTGSGLAFSIIRAYSTISAWETACPANLRTDDSNWKGVCYSDAVINELIDIQGMTAGYGNDDPNDGEWYVLLTAAQGHEQDGIVGGAGVTVQSTSGNAQGGIRVQIQSTCRVIVEKIRIIRTSTNHQLQAFCSQCSRLTIRKCLFIQASSLAGQSARFLSIQQATTSMWFNRFYNNVMVWNSSNTGVLSNVKLEGASATGSYDYRCIQFFNNTIIGKSSAGAIEILHTSSYSDAKTLCQNNYVYNYGTGNDFTFGTNYTNTEDEFRNNASDDTTAGTSNDNMQVAFADANFKVETVGSQNLRLDAGSLLIGEGRDLNYYGFPVTDDNQSITRTAPWDIGAFKYVAEILFKAFWARFTNVIINKEVIR